MVCHKTIHIPKHTPESCSLQQSFTTLPFQFSYYFLKESNSFLSKASKGDLSLLESVFFFTSCTMSFLQVVFGLLGMLIFQAFVQMINSTGFFLEKETKERRHGFSAWMDLRVQKIRPKRKIKVNRGLDRKKTPKMYFRFYLTLSHFCSSSW